MEKIQAVGMLVYPPVPSDNERLFSGKSQKLNDYPIHFAAGFLWIAP